MIELKLDQKWKWAAMDEDGEWVAYSEKPYAPRERVWWNTENDRDGTSLSSFVIETARDWRDSLHEIIHQDGKVYLKKHVDIPADGEPVIVWESPGREVRRYSSGKTDDAYRLLCYLSGATKWSTDERVISWENWRRPTPEELAE